jgi:hypothetical protein
MSKPVPVRPGQYKSLAIGKRIAEYGTKLHVKSKPGDGVGFSFALKRTAPFVPANLSNDNPILTLAC